MTLTDLREQAERLIEEEDRAAAESIADQTIAEEEGRLQGAIKRIQDQRRAEAAERERQSHTRKSDELGVERRELEDHMEGDAISFLRNLKKLEALNTEHQNELRLAGRPTSRPYHDSLEVVVSSWLADKYHGSLTARTLSSPWPVSDKTLAERDKLTP